MRVQQALMYPLLFLFSACVTADPEQEKTLDRAATEGDLQAVQMLVGEGVNVETPTTRGLPHTGLSALDYALLQPDKKANQEIVQMLTKALME